MSQKYGRPNEKTPAQWNTEYTDYNAPADGTIPTPNAADPTPLAERPSRADVESAPPVAPNGEVAEDMELDDAHDATAALSEKKDKKRKHEGETAEEKAERKRKKKEKKEKKEKRKSKGGDSDSD